MAETGTNVLETSQTTEQSNPQNGNGISPELAKQMELSLNPGAALQNGNQQAATQNGEADKGEVQQSGQEAAAVVTDPFSIFKDKFGYQSPEDAIKDIEELRNFKTAAPVVDVEFENEQSEKLFKAIKSGNNKEVYKMLEMQDRLDSLTSAEVNKDTAADIIKYGMQLKYKDLTQSEIEYKFNKQFAIPKTPVQSTEEMDEDFEARKQQWKEQVEDIEREKVIEAKLIRPELESAKSKIVFPDVEQTIDEDYIQYRKMLDEQPKLNAQVVEAYKAFTPKAIETKVNFTDEPNKIAFEFQHEPDSESFSKAVEVAKDFNLFFENFKNQDGTPDRQKFLRAIHFALNGDNIVMEAIKQAKNATIKSFLPDNGASGIQRQFPQTQELSELDKQMQTSLRGY